MTTHSHDRPRAANCPLFSVIVPFLDEEGWLPRCLAALRAQTIDPALIAWILIDNGSTDRSAEIVRAEPRAALLAEPRRDPYIARNRGILALGYAAFLAGRFTRGCPAPGRPTLH